MHPAKCCVLVMGPEAGRPFLDSVASALVDEPVEVLTAYDLARPSDHPLWSSVQVLVAYSTPCSVEDLASATALRAIILPSLGYEGVDVEAATRRNIAVANGRVAENAETVAEAAVLFMLMSLYDVQAAEERLRRNAPRSGPPKARMLKGKTVGVIGFGSIAKALVERLRPWGVTILVHSRSPFTPPFDAVKSCDLDTLLSQSDVVLPLVPLTPDTHRLIDATRMMQMKKGAILVNLSRGAVIEESALSSPDIVDHLGAVALDVFEAEPLPASSALRHHPHAILTQHEIAHTAENLTALFDMAVENIRRAVRGMQMPTQLNLSPRHAPGV